MPRQNRRSLLLAMSATGLASTSGCIGSIPVVGGEEVEPLSLSTSDVDDDSDPFSIEIDPQDQVLDAENAPTLSIALENPTDKTIGWDEVSRGTYTGTPFTSSMRARPGRNLVLVVGGWSLENEEGCVSITIADDSLADLRTEFEVGERLEDEFTVVGIDENLEGGCPEAGSYRFEHSWRDRSGENIRSWLWGFEVELTKA